MILVNQNYVKNLEIGGQVYNDCMHDIFVKAELEGKENIVITAHSMISRGGFARLINEQNSKQKNNFFFPLNKEARKGWGQLSRGSSKLFPQLDRKMKNGAILKFKVQYVVFFVNI